MLLAHSRNDSGATHGLAEHCRSTGLWAGRFAEAFNASALGYALGLFHDAGKAACAWQDRLRVVDGTDTAVGLDHKMLGTRLLWPVASLATMAVAGHHGGLTSWEAVRQKLLEATVDEDAQRRFLAEIPEAGDVLAGKPLVPTKWTKPGNQHVLDMGLRLVFSALVDADHLDTGAHRRGLPGPRVAAPADFGRLVERFEKGRAELLADRPISPMDALRTEVYDAAVGAVVRAAADRVRSGVFRLPAPTGAGKTLAQAGFALRHAAESGKSRVIVAVPFTTVTEQNAKVYRNLLSAPGENTVLEHHSAVRWDPVNDEEDCEHHDWRRLAAENWDAPFVVTTTVQLFDSLFGRKPARSRKLHRLANAVIVLDEVQALPHRLLLPILSGLRTLTEEFNTTVLLTSATQPKFQALSVWKDRGTDSDEFKICEIIDQPQPLFDRARRVTYRWRVDPRPTLEEVAGEISREHQVLVVTNKIKDARTLYHLLKEQGADVWHLSTRLCGHHRGQTLDVVSARLRDNKPVILVSTNLIEAGVDIDFPVVWRAVAPADSILQSAGRCNRNGRRSPGLVVVFHPVDSEPLCENRMAVDLAMTHFGPGGRDIEDQSALAVYYEELYDELSLDRRTVDRSRLNVGNVIQDHRAKLDFQAVAEGPVVQRVGENGVTVTRDRNKAFRMINSDTTPVVIPGYGDAVADLLGELAEGKVTDALVMRRLQPWIVQLQEYQMKDPTVIALLRPIVGDLHVWQGEYDWDPVHHRGIGLDGEEIQLIH